MTVKMLDINATRMRMNDRYYLIATRRRAEGVYSIWEDKRFGEDIPHMLMLEKEDGTVIKCGLTCDCIDCSIEMYHLGDLMGGEML